MRTEPKHWEPGLSIMGSEAQGREQATVRDTGGLSRFLLSCLPARNGLGLGEACPEALTRKAENPQAGSGCPRASCSSRGRPLCVS